MTKEQIGGLIRTAAAYGFGLLVSKGVIDGGMADQLAGAVAAIAIAVWSVLSKKTPTASGPAA